MRHSRCCAPPEVVNAFHVTGEGSWFLEIAVIDVEHLDAVVARFCLLAETSTSIVPNMPRENATVLPRSARTSGRRSGR